MRPLSNRNWAEHAKRPTSNLYERLPLTLTDAAAWATALAAGGAAAIFFRMMICTGEPVERYMTAPAVDRSKIDWP